MAISSQRFRFLDQETNIGTSDFLSLSDNSVYTAAVETADTVADSIREGESVLGTMADSISDLMDKVSNASNSIINKIKDALNAAIDKIMSMKLPKFITKILDSLKKLDLGGVKGFFKDLLRVGSAFLCNNLDFLKSFMLGYSLTENILSGLVIGLLLGWLDRYCKGFTKQEVLAASNKGKLGMLFSSDGITLTPETVLGSFSNAYSDFIRASATYTPNLPPSTSDFLSKILNGKGQESVSSLRSAEISSKKRKEYLTFLEQNLSNYQPNTTEYNSILDTRAQLINTPLISEARIEQANNYINLNDALGSMALNLKGVDISEINTHSLSATEQTLLVKLEEFKATVANNSDIRTRDHEQGSFSDFNFSTILPPPTEEEKIYLNALPGLEESYRYNGLHPTTEVFTESSMPNSTRPTVEQEQITLKPATGGVPSIGVVSVVNTPPDNPILGTTFNQTQAGGVAAQTKNLNNTIKLDTALTDGGTKPTNVTQEAIFSKETQITGLGGSTGKVVNPAVAGSSTDRAGSSFDKPYIPTPVVPGSCYA